MKKGILVVSFGTSYKETREKCIESIEHAIGSNYPEYEIRRAFTSNMIIKKLKERDGIYIDTPLEALEKMVSDGFENIHVQPLHVIPGFEYEKVTNAVVKIKHKSNISISVGSPLLNKEEHYDEMIEALMSRLPNEKSKEGVLLMGHGTDHFANACYSMLQNKISDVRGDVIIANVEGYPEIDDVIEDIEEKFSKMTLMPLMIVAGDHAINDMAGDEDSYKTMLSERNIETDCILEGLGQNEGIQDIFVKRVAESLRDQ
ncbi:MAG: sirohydrochlorin cobaltochelatase [Tissierellales bacterium]|jgi:sirohydrochlorin cobaltochelatase|nr:sirohydrochlorin cobaltochelatase [Tissierellales bacterium]